MADKSDKILETLALSEEHQANNTRVTEAFRYHLIGKYNVIYKHAGFNSRCQYAGETVENYYRCTQTCTVLQIWSIRRRND